MERRDAEEAESAKKFGSLRDVPSHLNELSRRVIGAAIEVHRRLGPGFLEGVYEEAMALELRCQGVPFQRQVTLPVTYRDQLVGESRLDLLVDEELVVELKAVEAFRQVHRAQVLSYLRAGSFQLGLIINFNVGVLIDGVRRVIWTL
jgi:GxxExxY protein